METFKTYLIIAMIGFILVIIRHIPELYSLDFKIAGLDIFDKLTDALWVAVFISLLIGHLIEQASYEKIKHTIRDMSMHIESAIHDALEHGRNILRANDDATVRSQQNIFVAAFRKTIPQDVFDAANKVIFGTKFYRTNHQHSWRFKVLQIDGLTRLAVNVTASYTILNLTGTPEDFAIHIQFERSNKPPNSPVVKFIEIDGKHQDLSKMKESPEVAGDPNVVYEVPSIVIPGDGRVHIKLEFQFIRKLEDREIWLSAYPEDGMELRIYDPDNCRRIEFKADAIGPLAVQTTQSEDGVTALIRETMLPFQGLSFSWEYEIINASSALP